MLLEPCQCWLVCGGWGLTFVCKAAGVILFVGRESACCSIISENYPLHLAVFYCWQRADILSQWVVVSGGPVGFIGCLFLVSHWSF